MATYSLKKNLHYVGMVYCRPRQLLDQFATEPSLWYGLLPFTVLVALWELKNSLVDFCAPVSASDKLVPSFVPRGLSVGTGDVGTQMVIFALVYAFDVLLFAGVVYGLATLFRLNQVPVRSVSSFFMLVVGSISVLALLTDAILEFRLFGWDWTLLPYMHPLVALVEIAYLPVFVSRQASISRWQSAILVVPAMAVGIGSHVLFLL